MRESNRAILQFKTIAGNTVRLTVPRARLNNTATEALAAMEQIIATEAVLTSTGVPRTPKSAELQHIRRESIM